MNNFRQQAFLFFQTGIEQIPYTLSQKIVTDNGNQYSQPRIKREPPGDIDIVFAGSQDIAPTGRGRLHANA
jgi:hypothetical protein